MTSDIAATLPPEWDSVEHRQQIYSTFERVQFCMKCGNLKQAHLLMISLERLTTAAERRRQIIIDQVGGL